MGAVIHMLAHSFGPLVSPEQTRLKWFKENTGQPYPNEWPELIKQGYWGATTPRKVVPINLEAVTHEEDYRRQRPSPKYSDALNGCMMMALKMDPKERANAGELLEHVEEAHADFLFQELTIETMKETETGAALGYGDEDY
jgi:NIMA (never in mitosis gene a)-related kinase